MIVATVLRSGGPTYTPSWVWALKRGLNEHMTGDWRFRVLSDLPLNQWRAPLVYDAPGWWAKVGLFGPGVFPRDELVVYLDLDTLVTGDLSFFRDYSDNLAVLSDFYRPKEMATGVMAFRPGPHTEGIFEAFVQDPAGIMAQHRSRSDHWYARYMDRPDRIQDLFPGRVASFKVHGRTGVPEGCAVLCGHGKPRFSDPSARWAHDFWKERAAWST